MCALPGGCRQQGVQVSERQLTVRDIVNGQQSGKLLEVFGSGTACVVQPVGCVVMSDGRELTLPAGAAAAGSSSSGSGWGPEGAGSVAEWARKLLMDIQYGRVAGHPWSVAFD
jgi:branched-chain amino acid aminotransferase